MKGSLKNKKILITCGPTCVPIDDMRVISNRSSGQLGFMIAQECLKKKARVTLLVGPVADNFLNGNAKVIKFFFFEELRKLLKLELKKKYDVVIHAAAVSDYFLKKTFKSKLKSDHDQLKLELVQTPKLINEIKRMSPGVFLVGFKLESKVNDSAVRSLSRKLFKEALCDLVVVNTNTHLKYRAWIINKSQHILFKGAGKRLLAQKLVTQLN